ncbi:MAG: arginine--tRNA ligase [Tissierellia bacterium]|nr:arginine--tRNA ligase [Tissierellia bacterium]
MIDFRSNVVDIISEAVHVLDRDSINELVEIPPTYDMGDYAFPTFKLAKEFRKSPNMIAEELAEKFSQSELFASIEAKGSYVNFFINREMLAKSVIEDVIEQKDRYGSSDLGGNRKVLVEFSSPNIAKPFHIGHIRTTVIGNSLAKIYDFLGFDVVKINHLGDYGTQFGMLISAYKKWGDREIIEQNPIKELLALYIKFNDEADKNETLRDEARYWFKKLENKDPEAIELWEWIRKISLKEFNRVYDLLNISFDSFTGESFYSDKMPSALEEMKQKGIVEESEGALIVDLEEYDMPPALIMKKDGSTLYTTRDVAAALYRKKHYDFYKNIYVVGSQQNLHFKAWIKIIELMGYDWAKDCIHVPFGMVSLEEGTLSTRKGRVVFLEDVLNKAIESTRKIIEERNPGLEDKENVAKQVGIGAILFQELFNQRIKDYTFNWEKTLSFEGETGPYVQYTHARANSLLEKGEFKESNEISFAELSGEDEINIIRMIYDFPNVIISSMEKNEPFFITRQIVEIAKAFNTFYNSKQIIVENEEIKNARLSLVYATKTVIKVGLSLLGIEAPNKM